VWADYVKKAVNVDDVMRMSSNAVLLARSYTWRGAAQSLALLTEDLARTSLLHC